ncbi:DUF721 domain-containing protein [Deinococcus maricopensis]|uniref:DUF721 domain-containing protein n=1 Tax=Deinococcus maricopensis (strain DSM 21211 / LMG 22137 / NRRL B-23946 / LB-34) TaxID=709986 RepID=E8U9S3_DEIML|nr:DciA family protein [Deinococcus maricopensis]ADV67812.1 protein of unknown function DUF721 [Deinococcus maricopensis DSM 21211]
MSRRGGGPRNMSALLQQTLGKHRLARGVGRARAILAWPGVVGPELARLTRARSQHGPVLYVEARDHVLANFLTMQRMMFLERLQAALGDESVTELRFTVGTIHHKPAAPPPEPLPAPDREAARRMASATQGSDLHRVTLKAAEAVTRARRWRERQGYRPCPICGEPTPEHPCKACQVTLQNPVVRRAAHTLTRDPDRYPHLVTSLTESGADAARYLALGTLQEQLEVLALECVRSGGEAHYREFLAQQADTYLSLTLRKPRALLTPQDRRALPERVQHVLNA